MAPSRDKILEMFSPLSQQGRQAEFFDHVDDNVNWTILGHSPMAKTYTNKKDFNDATLTVLREKVLTEPLRLKVIHVTGGGEGEECATVEMQAIDAKCKNGLKYDMTYCWVLHFDKNDKIVRVRAYLDSKLLTDAMEQNM